MFLRLLVVLAALAGAGVYVHREQQAGRLQRVDEGFLDFLIANTRDRLERPEPETETVDRPVTLITLREADRGEYATWPPPPLDWQTVLKALHAYEPSVVVIATPLNWGRPAPDFVPAVGEALLPFPSVVLGIETQLAAPVPADAEARAAFLGDVGDRLPRFQRLDGSPLPAEAPVLGALITAPDALLRPRGELGLLSARRSGSDEPWKLPYALRESDTWVPTVLAQALARHSQTAYAWHRLRLGPGAGAHLSDGLFVPLTPSGEFEVRSAGATASVPTLNALHLMTGDLTGGLSAADREKLGKGKVMVLGLEPSDPAQPALARLYATALDQVLRLPRLRQLTKIQQWTVWGVAALAAVGLATRVRRAKALRTGLLLIFAAFVACFLAFQNGLWWCPPTLPAALLAVGALVGRCIGPKSALVPAAENVIQA